jgi:hypothetical protein
VQTCIFEGSTNAVQRQCKGGAKAVQGQCRLSHPRLWVSWHLTRGPWRALRSLDTIKAVNTRRASHAAHAWRACVQQHEGVTAVRGEHNML